MVSLAHTSPLFAVAAWRCCVEVEPAAEHALRENIAANGAKWHTCRPTSVRLQAPDLYEARPQPACEQESSMAYAGDYGGAPKNAVEVAPPRGHDAYYAPEVHGTRPGGSVPVAPVLVAPPEGMITVDRSDGGESVSATPSGCPSRAPVSGLPAGSVPRLASRPPGMFGLWRCIAFPRGSKRTVCSRGRPVCDMVVAPLCDSCLMRSPRPRARTPFGRLCWRSMWSFRPSWPWCTVSPC